MPLVRDLSEAQLAVEIDGLDDVELQILRYRGSEGLCQLYRFEIDLAVDGSEPLDLDEVVGSAMSLKIQAPHGDKTFRGKVGRIEVSGSAASETHYRLELVPRFWNMTRYHDSRIFQNMTTREIIAEVLDVAGFTTEDFSFELLSQEGPTREYCVQYRETDWNFIARLMEEEGWWWFFEHGDVEKLMVADSAAAYQPLEGSPQALPFEPPSGMNASGEHVFRFRRSRQSRSESVRTVDFNFKNPRLTLDIHVTDDPDDEASYYDYPGGYETQERGAEIAQVRSQELTCARRTATGMSNSHRLAPGRTFDLTDHPVETLNEKYLVTRVTHQGKQGVRRTSANWLDRPRVLDANTHQALLAAAQNGDGAVRDLARAMLQAAAKLAPADQTADRNAPNWLYHGGQLSQNPSAVAMATGGDPVDALTVHNLLADAESVDGVDVESPTYECRFECIPADITFRPPRITPWPLMRGCQTAIVVGPEGEEIHTDEYGRVQVQFPWDRHGGFAPDASCWIRVSSSFAGGGYGALFLPRVGHEVIVDFLEGNPDKPIITGRVYNGDLRQQFELPKHRTLSYIKTQSSNGGGGCHAIMFEDLKDEEYLFMQSQRDFGLKVKRHRVESIDGQRHLTVGEERYELIKKHKYGEVRLDFHEKVGGNKSLAVGGSVAEQFGGAHSESCGSYYLTTSKGEVVIESQSKITLKVGGNFVCIHGGGVDIMGTVVNINSGGSAGNGVGAPMGEVPIPAEAPVLEPGYDINYLTAPATGEPPPAEAEQPESWIEIELVDEAGQPWPGEPFEVTGPDGKVYNGVLDDKGQAHLEVDCPGMYHIRFTNLDMDAWERA